MVLCVGRAQAELLHVLNRLLRDSRSCLTPASEHLIGQHITLTAWRTCLETEHHLHSVHTVAARIPEPAYGSNRMFTEFSKQITLHLTKVPYK